MYDPHQFKECIVEPALKEMAEHFNGAYSDVAVNLMMGTAWQESLGGTFLKQLSGGPGLGPYQVEPDTHIDIFDNFLSFRPDDCAFVMGMWPFDAVQNARFDADADIHELLVYNLRYATVIARLKYWRNNFDWPDNPNDIQALGQIWDRIYNANPDHGFPEDFTRNFPEEILT